MKGPNGDRFPWWDIVKLTVVLPIPLLVIAMLWAGELARPFMAYAVVVPLGFALFAFETWRTEYRGQGPKPTDTEEPGEVDR